MLDKCAMQTRDLVPNLISCNAVLNAFKEAGQFETAFGLLREMPRLGIRPDVISYNTVLSACQKGDSELQFVLRTLQVMKKNGVLPNRTSYKVAITCCLKHASFGSALRLLRRAQRDGHLPVLGKKSNKNILTWDLHGFSLPIACLLLCDAFFTTLLKNGRLPNSIVIVTGKGHRSGPNGPVLKSGVPIFLQNRFGIESRLVEGNSGRLLFTRDILIKWSKSNAWLRDTRKRKLLSSVVLRTDGTRWTTDDYALVDDAFGGIICEARGKLQ